jgi:hypothetical protein
MRRLSAQHRWLFVEKSSVAISYYFVHFVSFRERDAIESAARAVVSPARNAVGHEAAVDHRRGSEEFWKREKEWRLVRVAAQERFRKERITGV